MHLCIFKWIVGLAAIALSGSNLAVGNSAYLVRDYTPGNDTLVGAEPGRFCQIGNITYFSAAGPSGTELYRTDGTNAGTFMVKDINPIDSSYPLDLVNFNGTLYFSARTELGRELWKSDGTNAGTQIVADINPTGSSIFEGFSMGESAELTIFGGYLYFLASPELTESDQSQPLYMYRTDGTSAGTVQAGLPGESVGDIEAAGSVLYFTSDGLYKSDGTQAGTSKLTLPSGGRPYDLTDVNDTLFFGLKLTNDSPYGAAVYKTLGTNASTALVKQFNADTIGYDDAYLEDLFNFNGKLIFSGGEGSSGPEPWISDGTPGGTVMLANINPNVFGSGAGHGSYPGNFSVCGNKLWFAADDQQTLYDPFDTYNGGHPLEEDMRKDPWISDGTPAGTYKAFDLNSSLIENGYVKDHPANFTQLGDKVYFTASYAVNVGEYTGELTLYQSDGTAAGTQVFDSNYRWSRNSNTEFMPDIFSRPDMLLINGARYNPSGPQPSSRNDAELWKLRSNISPLELIKEIGFEANSSDPTMGTVYGGKLYYEDEAGFALSQSDGSFAGTIDCSFTGTRFLGLVNNRLFFERYDGFQTNSDVVYSTDGTSAGTIKLVPYFENSTSNDGFVPFANSVLITTYSSETYKEELWISNGLQAGTTKLFETDDDIAKVTATQGSFAVFAEDNGTKLWRTDGTIAGTILLKDFGTQRLDHFTVLGDNTVAFSVNDGNSLWKTDGTVAGTMQVASNTNLVTAVGYIPRIRSIVPFAGMAILLISDGSIKTSLWESDGTLAGTHLIHPDFSYETGSDFAVAGKTDTKLFFVLENLDTGTEPWVYDATATSITLLKDIRLGEYSSVSANNVGKIHQDNFYFYANDGVHGTELWRSDGTPAGTQMVADLAVGLESSFPSEFLSLGSALVFAANTTATGMELFVLDQPMAEPRLFQDINPGGGSSKPGNLFPVPALQRVFFAAETDLTGRELWAFPYTGTGLPTAAQDWQLYN